MENREKVEREKVLKEENRGVIWVSNDKLKLRERDFRKKGQERERGKSKRKTWKKKVVRWLRNEKPIRTGERLWERERENF